MYRASGLRSVMRGVFAFKCRRFDFLRDARNLPRYAAAQADLKAYFDRTFQDSPGGGGHARRPFASWAAHIVNRIAATYHWPEVDILNTPLRRLYQYLNCIRIDNDPQAVLHSPSDVARNAKNRLKNQRVTLVKLLQKRVTQLKSN